jgi:hypothetical protein
VLVDSSYAGCKSWVDLTDAIDISNLTPAISDSEFATRLTDIRDALAIESVNV